MKKVLLISLLISLLLLTACGGKAVSSSTVSASAEAKTTIVCLGDSITFGIGASDGKTMPFPAQLKSLLGSGYSVKNYGQAGATGSLNGDHPYDKTDSFQKALRIKADLYIIMFGTNDAKVINWDAADYQEGMKEILRQCKEANPDAGVYLMIPPVAYPYPGDDCEWESGYFEDINPDTIRNEIAPILKALASENHYGLIDLNTLTTDHADWFTDGIHPNDTGYEAIANRIYEELSN